MHINKIKYLFIPILVLTGCGDESADNKIVARVKHAYLTEKEVESALSSEKNNGTFREEYIRNWVEKEILYNEALERKVENKEFREKLDESRKQLAIAFFLDKYFGENHLPVNEKEFVEYFNKNRENYSVNSEAVIYNEIKFKDERQAILFRNRLIETDWETASEGFDKDSIVILNNKNHFEIFNEFPSVKLAKVLNVLNKGEVSIILEEEPNVFLVAQVIAKLKKNEIPELNYVREKVMEDFEILQKKKLFSQLINTLYSKYNVEIKQEF